MTLETFYECLPMYMNVYEVYDEYNNLLCDEYLHLPADESELSQRIVRGFDINSSNTRVKVYLEGYIK